MKALRVKNGSLSLDHVPRPDANGEAVVRVLASGICNTDLEIVRGYAGFAGTIGHEFVGVVEESAGRPDLIGKRVVGEINAGCGSCECCAAGDPRHCPKRTVLGIVGRDGCHAEFLALPARNLIEVPDEVSDREAVFVEPLAAANGVLEHLTVDSGSRVAVIGDGKLGLLCAMALQLRFPNIILIGRHRSKLRIAEQSGVEGVLEKDAQMLERGFDVVVEASGAESGFAAAVSMVRPRGTIVLKSTFHGPAVWPASRIVVDEITVAGSRCGRFGPAIELLRERRIDVATLISDEFALSSGVEAIERAGEKGVLKVLLRMAA